MRSAPAVTFRPIACESPLNNASLVELAFAVVFAAGLEGEDLQVAGEALELGQQVSYRHLRSVARQALYVVLSQGSGVVAVRPFGAVMTR